MAYRNEKRMLYALEEFARLCRTLYEDSFQQNITVRSLLGLSFKPRRLPFKKDAVPTICNFPGCTLQACNWTYKRQKNKRIMPSEQLANSSAIYQVKKGSHERLANAETQQCSENDDVTKQSFSSIPSIKLRGQFGNAVFVKPSAHFVLLTFLFFTSAQKKNAHKFPFKCFVYISRL